MNEEHSIFEREVPEGDACYRRRRGHGRSPNRCRRVALRAQPAPLPDVPEWEVVRHFTRLSQRNWGVDTGFYPLGSCTMKHNPRVNEVAARLPGLARVHPDQHPAQVQGMLRLLKSLEEALAEISGMDAVTLQPPQALRAS